MCRLCSLGAVEDEHHVLLDCPAYNDTRTEFQMPAVNMKDCMATFDQAKLACYLDRIWALRNNSYPFWALIS